MRQTLNDAAKMLLKNPIGTETNIVINISDGLTGLPPGPPARGSRQRTVDVRVEQQTREGKTRTAVVGVDKGVVLAATTWIATTP
jgi:hypothetical protein